MTDGLPPALASRFKSPERAAQFVAAYNAALALWPVPHEPLDVQTGFGVTHINAAGSPDSPPLVLIHGAQMSSTVWFPNIEPLSRHFRVYAVDMIDQMGLSLPTRKLRTPQDCVDWLTDVLDALNLERATLIGHSEGGWQALNMAIKAPERVERLVLLCPAPALVRLRWQVFLRMTPIFVIPTRRMFYGYFRWASTLAWNKEQPHPLIEQFVAGVRAFKPQELSLTVISVFDDDELRQVQSPTLLLVGDHEVVYDPQAVLTRARQLMPHIEAELIPGGGHLFPIDRPDATNARMLAFLKDG